VGQVGVHVFEGSFGTRTQVVIFILAHVGKAVSSDTTGAVTALVFASRSRDQVLTVDVVKDVQI